MKNRMKNILKIFMTKGIVDWIHYANYVRFFKKMDSLDRKEFIERFNQVQTHSNSIINVLKGAEPKVIFDIGAHFGEMSYFFSRVYNNAEIYSFEPTKKTYRWAQKLARQFGLKNVKLKNMGLGDMEGISYIDTSEDSAMNHVSKEGEKILIGTLDRFVSKNKIDRIDFIKCDVEGFEYFVFKGGLKSIRKFKPIIFCEIQEKWFKRYGGRNLLSLLKKEGYEAFVFKDKLKNVTSLLDSEEDYYLIHRSKINNIEVMK